MSKGVCSLSTGTAAYCCAINVLALGWWVVVVAVAFLQTKWKSAAVRQRDLPLSCSMFTQVVGRNFSGNGHKNKLKTLSSLKVNGGV